MAPSASRAGSKLATVRKEATMQRQLTARMPRREYSGAESFLGSRRRRLERRRFFRKLWSGEADFEETLREDLVDFLRRGLRCSERRTFPVGRWRWVEMVCEMEEERRAEREEARRVELLPSITIL